jgi:hypothetical protein
VQRPTTYASRRNVCSTTGTCPPLVLHGSTPGKRPVRATPSSISALTRHRSMHHAVGAAHIAFEKAAKA